MWLIQFLLATNERRPGSLCVAQTRSLKSHATAFSSSGLGSVKHYSRSHYKRGNDNGEGTSVSRTTYVYAAPGKHNAPVLL